MAIRNTPEATASLWRLNRNQVSCAEDNSAVAALSMVA